MQRRRKIIGKLCFFILALNFFLIFLPDNGSQPAESPAILIFLGIFYLLVSGRAKWNMVKGGYSSGVTSFSLVIFIVYLILSVIYLLRTGPSIVPEFVFPDDLFGLALGIGWPAVDFIDWVSQRKRAKTA